MPPLAVVVASLLQLLLAATFVVVPFAGARYGPAAQRAAETEVARQGFPATVLARRGIDFGASGASIVLAVAIGLALAALAALGLAGNGTGRIVSWVFQIVVLVLGGLIVMPGEVFTVRYVEAGFRRSRDPDVRGMDVAAFVDAARDAYPGWMRLLIVVRFGLATLGSLLVVVLLATPAANAYFR